MKAVKSSLLTWFRWSTLVLALLALAAHAFCSVALLQWNATSDLRFAPRSIANPTIYVTDHDEAKPSSVNPWSVLSLTQVASSLFIALHLVSLNLQRGRNP